MAAATVVFGIIPRSCRNTNRTKWLPSITVKHGNFLGKTTDRMAAATECEKRMAFLEWRHNAIQWDDRRAKGRMELELELTDSRLTAFDILMGQTSFWGPPFGDWLPPKRKIYDNITSHTTMGKWRVLVGGKRASGGCWSKREVELGLALNATFRVENNNNHN